MEQIKFVRAKKRKRKWKLVNTAIFNSSNDSNDLQKPGTGKMVQHRMVHQQGMSLDLLRTGTGESGCEMARGARAQTILRSRGCAPCGREGQCPLTAAAAAGTLAERAGV